MSRQPNVKLRMLRFFWLGTTAGFGILVLLALTAVAVVVFFARDSREENVWQRLIAPLIATALLAGIVILAVRNYPTLLGVSPSDPAAWALPASYAAGAAIGVVWVWCSRPATRACTPPLGLVPAPSRPGSAQPITRAGSRGDRHYPGPGRRP